MSASLALTASVLRLPAGTASPSGGSSPLLALPGVCTPCTSRKHLAWQSLHCLLGRCREQVSMEQCNKLQDLVSHVVEIQS